MASLAALSLIFRVSVPAGGIGAAYLVHRARFVDWRAFFTHFFTGPGRLSRILLVFFVVTNWKSLPFAWTVCPPPPHLSSLSRHSLLISRPHRRASFTPT
jgi:hypothetical protein